MNKTNTFWRRLWVALCCMLLSASFSSAQEKIKLPVSASSKTLGYSPLWVAWRQGFFERQGLDVQVVFVEGADKSVMALIGGSTFVAAGAADAMMTAVDQGLDLVAIGGVINGLTHFILGGKKFKTYEDLKGATIGSSGLTSGTTFVLRRVLKIKGLEFPRDYKLLNVGGSGPALAALAAGRVDAGIIALPLGYEGAELGLNVVGKVNEVIPDYQLTVLTVKRSWAEKNRPLVVRFMKAMVQSMRWLHDHKETAIDFLSKEMKLKPQQARRGWEYYTENKIWNPNSEINIDGMKVVAQINAERTQAKGPVPAPTKYIDLSYVQEALKELGTR
jgi:ABC-type nitrate/sulfonate/bicarbonate transport system substrate-binding protein